MLSKNQIKYKEVLELRKKGFSYSEIMKEVDVPKSTICDWVNKRELTIRQKDRLERKRIEARLKGAKAQKDRRINKENQIEIFAKNNIEALIQDPLWLMGIILYWGEGNKSKPWRVGERVIFTNMDFEMVVVFKKWLIEKFGIDENDINYNLYIHDSYKKIDKIKEFWSDKLSIKKDKIIIYYKRSKGDTLRKNIDLTYHGVMRLKVARSTDLNRKIMAYIKLLIKMWD